MCSSTIVAYYLGFCETNSLAQNKTSSRAIEEKVIEQLENAQLSGKVLKSVSNLDKKIHIEMSKYGLKIVESSTGDVALRVPLIQLILFTTFRDGFGKINGVILENTEQSTHKRYKSHLIQFADENSEKLLSRLIKDSFREAEDADFLTDAMEPPSPSLVDNQ